MPLFGEIVVIKRNGTDGTHFPLTANSCLFGRKKECDIRIQLPRVSKEHCKIEVNENKEATLINLSAVNPTLLNGSSLQHPTCLKHKDVLTIIDRSFRFEYPPLSVPQKRNSISQEKETLQVLHLQQVDQEESLHQDSEYKSLQTPDKKLEWEGQNTHESDKQKTEEHITIQYGTPKSAYKTRRSNRKNEISPFSQLYYLMKSGGERQSTKGLSNEIAAQQKEYPLRKDDHDHLEEVSTRTLRRRSAYKKIEAVIQEEAEQSRKIENQEISSVVCSLVSVEDNNSKKSSLSLQTYASEKKLTDEEITDHIDFQDIKENELEISEVIKSYASLRANTPSAEGIPKSCCIVSLEYSDGAKSKKPTEATDEKIKSSLTDTFESENSLSTPKYKGKLIQINSSPHSQEVSTSSSESRMLPVEDNSLLGIFSPIESSIKTEGSSMYVNREDYGSNIFKPNMHFDIKEINTLLVTEQPLDPEILKETKDLICDTSDPYKERNFGIIPCSPYRRSPRRSMRQNKDFANEDCFKGKLTEKESLETPTSVSPGCDRMRTPSQLSEQTVGNYCPQKTDKKLKEKPAINHEQDFVIKSNIQGSSNLTESSLKSSLQMPSKEAVSEMTVSSPLNVKREAGVKNPPQKRKNREVDLLNQPFEKRKRVSFGGHLSPELFDKRLPPNSPLKKGAMPARLSLLFGNSPRAVLKKASERGQSVSKDSSERKQRENILPQKAASPPARRSPAASPPARRSPAASPPARRSPAASPPARRSPAASPPARRSPAASPPARRSPAASPPARRSPAASPPARRSPAASPPARRSPARRSPAASPPARRSPAASPPAASPPAHRSPAASPPARRSPAASPPAASPPARRSSAASPSSSFSCDMSQKRGRFFVSRITSPSSLVEQAAIIGEQHVHEEFIEAKSSVEQAAIIGVQHVHEEFTEAKSSVEQAAIIGEQHVHEEFTEAKSPEPSEHEFKATPSIRRSKRFSLKRNSLHRTSGAINAIYSKRRSGASGANLIVAKSWAEVVKQGVPKSQLRISTKCGLTRRAKKTSKQPKSNVPVLKTPARKVKGYFTTGHANSPAPIVIGKAHTSIVKIAAQAPKVMLNFPVKQHCDLNESFTGVADMFNTPLNWKQKNSMSSVEKTNMSTPEVSVLHSADNSGEMIVPSFTVSSQQICKQDVSPFLIETSQVSSLVEDRLKMSPRGENTEEEIEEIVKESSSLGTSVNETLVGVQVTRKSAKHKLESDVFSGIQRLMRTPKQKPEPAEALSGVKRLMRTPKTKPEPVEALSGVKRLMRTPKTKPEPVEALSGVKRLMRTPKTKPEPVEALSGIKRLVRTPKEKPKPVEALSEVMRAESKMKLFEDEPACSTVSETSEEVLQELQGSVTKRTPKQRAQPVGITGISYIIEELKEKIHPVEDPEGTPRLLRGSKQRSEHVEEIVGISSQLKTPAQFKTVDGHLGLQKFMAEPRQSYFSPEIDYSGVKEMFDMADEYKVKLPESGNLMEDCESHLHFRSELEISGIVPENEELQQDTKLEDVFERKSSLVIPKDHCRNDQKAEDSLEDLAVISLNEFKIGADDLPENSQPFGMDIQNGTTIDSGKTKRQGSSRIMDAELLEPLASTRQTRKGKSAKSNSTEEPNTKKSQSCAKSTTCMQTPENSDENLTGPRPEMTRFTRGKSRQHSAERNTDTESDTIMQTKETSGKIHQSVKRQVAAKGLGQAEAHSNSKETATTEENGSRLITKTYLRARNKKDDKNGLKSEFKKINPQDNMQCKDLEHSEIKYDKNDVFKRNTRRKRGDPIQTGSEKDKLGSLEFITQETSGMASLQSNPTKLKENIVRKGKGRRNVHFLLEEHNSVPLVEECVVVDESVAHEENDNALLERSVPTTKGKTLRGRKRKAPVASLPVSTSPPRKNELTEMGQAEHKEGISLLLEHSTFVKEESLGSSNFVLAIQNKDIKFEDLFERKSLVISRDNCRNEPKVEDSLEDLAVSSLNEIKIVADVESIKIRCVPENSQPVDMDIQNGNTIASGKTERQGSPCIMDAELLEPLASTRQTRKGKSAKSNSIEEPNTKKTRSRAKSSDCMQAHENSGENVIEPRPEMTKRSTRGKSRQHLAERNADMESDTVMQTQEPSKETSVKINQSVKRQVAAKGLGQAEAHSNSKETATTEENGSRLITKTYLRARNKKDDKNGLKSEFKKINPQDNMQCKDLEHSEIKYDKNDVFKRNTRRKRGDPIQTGSETDKLGSLEFITQETSGTASLESNPTKLKETIVRKGKGRRNVHFLLEEHNSVPLVEECVVVDESVAHEENDNALLERSVPTTKGKTLRGRKRKAPVASLPVSTSPTRMNELTEMGQAEHKEGISLPLEHSTFVKDDSLGSSSFVPEKCSHEIEKNEILQNVQTLDHSPAKQQKVIKRKPIKRGQSKLAVSQETSTDYDHQAADIHDQNMAIAIIENVSKRGRRMIAPVSQVSLPLENSRAKEIPSTDNFYFAQAKGSLQYIKNEEIPTEIQNVALKNAQAPIDDSASKIKNVTQDHTLRRGRSKHAISHETAIKYENKGSADTQDQNVVVKNAFSTKENPSKRGRVKKVAPVSQTLSSLLKNDNLPSPSSANSKSTEEHDKDLGNAEFTTANGSLSHRGRRRKMEDIPKVSSVYARKRSKLRENDQEKVLEDLQGVTKDNVYKKGKRNLIPNEISAACNGQPGNDSKEVTPINEKPLENCFGKDNQPMRSRRKNVPASQIPSLKVSITLPSAPSDKGETTSEHSMLIRHAIGEEKTVNNGGKVPCSTAARRGCKLPEEICQEKQNVDLEKTAISNERESRRGRRKADAPETTVSISRQEKCGLTVKRGIISKDQHEIPKHPQRKASKGKNLQKNIDASNISNDDQNSNLGLVLPEKGNSFKQGKQKQVISEPESSIPTSDMKKTFTENISKPTAGSTESTTLQRRKRKMKESQTAVASVEMENKTRGSRRTRK